MDYILGTKIELNGQILIETDRRFVAESPKDARIAAGKYIHHDAADIDPNAWLHVHFWESDSDIPEFSWPYPGTLFADPNYRVQFG